MSAAISKDLQEFVKGKLGWVATAGQDGMPNVTPKGTIQVLDENTLIFADLFSQKTRENLKHNSKVAVTLVDTEKVIGYQFKGTAELIEAGPVYEMVKAQLEASPKSLPVPTYVARITVEEIYDQTPGPNAGKKIA